MSYHNRLPGSCNSGQPCRSYYQVLEISPEERDPQVIEEAALRCSSRVRVYQVVRALECAKELNEIAQALNTLMDPALRREYDQSLAKPTDPIEAEPPPIAIPIPPALLRETRVASPSVGQPYQFRSEDAKSCDVRLVYRSPAV
jgi:hypothetical protein